MPGLATRNATHMTRGGTARRTCVRLGMCALVLLVGGAPAAQEKPDFTGALGAVDDRDQRRSRAGASPPWRPPTWRTLSVGSSSSSASPRERARAAARW